MGMAARTFERLPVSYRGRDLVLYRVGGTAIGVSADRRLVVMFAHVVWLAMLAGGLAMAGSRLRTRRHPASAATPLR
jgi:hypothetical protein